nr:DUF6504 family protein [Clavibacter michiganensis]
MSVATTSDGIPTRLDWDGRTFDVVRKPSPWVNRSAWWSTAARAPRGASDGLLEHLVYRLTIQDQAGHLVVVDATRLEAGWSVSEVLNR